MYTISTISFMQGEGTCNGHCKRTLGWLSRCQWRTAWRVENQRRECDFTAKTVRAVALNLPLRPSGQPPLPPQALQWGGGHCGGKGVGRYTHIYIHVYIHACKCKEHVQQVYTYCPRTFNDRRRRCWAVGGAPGGCSGSVEWRTRGGNIISM